MKSIDFSLVLLGFHWNILKNQWFYQVVDERCWFFIGFTRLWMKSIDFSLVLQGCGWKVLILRWFYEVVDANCWFLQWLWMTMVVFHWFLCEISPTTDPQPGAPFRGEQEEEHFCLRTAPGYRIWSRSFASPRPLARTNETKRFPGWGHKDSPPNLQ